MSLVSVKKLLAAGGLSLSLLVVGTLHAAAQGFDDIGGIVEVGNNLAGNGGVPAGPGMPGWGEIGKPGDVVSTIGGGFNPPSGDGIGNIIPGMGSGGPFLGFLNGGAGAGGGNFLQNASFLTFLLAMFQQGSNTQKSASTAMQNLQSVSKNGVSGVPASEAKPTPGNGTTNPPGNGSSTNPPAGNGSSNPNSPGKPTGVWQDPSKPGGNGNGNSKPGGSGSTPSKPGGSAAKPPPANDKPSQPPADNKPSQPPAAQPPSNPAPPPSGSGSTGQPSGTFFERGFVNSRF